MAYKYVYAPTKGLITSAPPTLLAKEATPYAIGMRTGNGEMISDFGYKQFPTRGPLKTNMLNGTVLKIEEFKKTDGTTQLICLTTTHAYVYNTATSAWDCITRSILINNCEAAWDAQANVTSTADTAVKLRGTYACKHVIAAVFGTGLASSEDDLSIADISSTTYTHLCFWIYSDIACAAGSVHLRLSEQAAGGVGAVFADYIIPALVAGEWQHITVDITAPGGATSGGTYPDDLNALASVALVVVVDSGAQTVYLDDIRTCACFSGDEDDRFSTAMMNNTYIVTNGVDIPMKFEGTVATGFEDLAAALASGAITKANVVFTLRDHVHFCNNTEDGSIVAIRDSWSDLGETEVYTGGTAGYQDLNDEPSEIMAAENLTQDIVLIYKKDSIIQCQWVGGATPFKYTTLKYGIGAQGLDCVTNLKGFHVIIGEAFCYTYAGGDDYKPLDIAVKARVHGSMDKTYITRSFMIQNKKNNKLQIWYATTAETPDRVMTLDLTYSVWQEKVRNATGWGQYKIESVTTIGDLAGLTIGELNWKIGDARTKANEPTILLGNASGEVFQIDETSNNEDGVAIASRFETPDFELSEAEIMKYNTNEFSVKEFGIEAKGNEVTLEWSSDSGISWSPTQGSDTNIITLTNYYAWYRQDFDATVTKVRFRFSNITISSGFRFRAYRFNDELRQQ